MCSNIVLHVLPSPVLSFFFFQLPQPYTVHYQSYPDSHYKLQANHGEQRCVDLFVVFFFLRDKKIDRMVNMKNKEEEQRTNRKDVSPRGFISCKLRRTENGRVGG